MTDIPDDRRERIAADPFCEKLGVELAELGPGTATTELTVTDDLLNFHGTPHGGAIYSLADAAFAAASNSEGDAALAMETNISYYETVEVGGTLTADAERIHRRGRTASYRVAVTDERGDEIATFRGRVYLPGE
ncbi:PaaI family thioesterase [Halorussus caseinilyticus]|uniref:PaaI family thioesterase n=1 Tax=Halorussus caseinilyticus TaxID=3034025 RepID=A0ABD5WLX7_9EURY|nr:hotdog fold thioesterase [Halorussus sp. DT72]